jgi:hypothetical protein
MIAPGACSAVAHRDAADWFAVADARTALVGADHAPVSLGLPLSLDLHIY